MATIEERIKRTGALQTRATAIGLALGVVVGTGYFLGTLDVVRAACLALGTWYTGFSVSQTLMVRTHGRLRTVCGSLLGFGVYAAVLLSQPAGGLACIPPAAFAFLAVYVVYNNAVYLANHGAREDDEFYRAITAMSARKHPAQTAAKVKDAQLKQLQARYRQLDGPLARAESAPEAETAGGELAGLIAELAEVAPLPDDLRAVQGRAYLALARHQIHRGAPELADTLQRAQDCPLPPGGADFVAVQYAARQERAPHALAAYQAYLRAHPGAPPHDPVVRAARALCLAGPADSAARLNEVEQLARGFLEADGTQGWAALSLGQVLLWRRQGQAALTYLQQAAQRLPGSSEALFYRGQAHAAVGQTEPALQSFRQALTLNPYDGEAAFWLAQTLVHEGRAENLPPAEREQTVAHARRLLEGLLAAQPARAEGHHALGLAHLAAGDIAAACASFSQALALNANEAGWHYHYARALVATGDHPAAAQAAQAAIERAPKHFPALLLLGREMRRAQRWPEAEHAFAAALDLDPDHAGALTGLGQALFELGRYGEVIQCLGGIESPERDALYYFGRAQARLDQFDDALAAYRTTAGKFGPDARLHYAAGCAHANLGQWKPALAAFEQSLALESAAAPHVQRGHVYLATGDRAAALAEYQSALRIAPESAEAHRALGAFHYASGNVRAAKESFTQAAELNPDDALIQMGLGAVQETQKHYAQAHSSYKAALKAGGPRAELQLRLGVIACKRKRFAEAVPLLAEARALIVPAAKPHTSAGTRQPDAAPEIANATVEDIGVELPAGGILVLISKGTPYPTGKAIDREIHLGDEFPLTGKNKRQCRIVLRQGPHDQAQQTRQLGEVVLDVPPNLPKGTRATLSLSLEDSGTLLTAIRLNDYPGWDVTARMQPLPALAPADAPRPAAASPAPEPARPDAALDELLYYLGLAHAQQEQWPEAIDAWSALAERCPDDAALQDDIARCRYQLGCRHFFANDFVAAAQVWEECARAMQDNALLSALAEAYFRRGSELIAPAARGAAVPGEALDALARARALEGEDSARIRTLTALGALAGGQHALAIEQLRALYMQSENDPRAAYHLGFALRQAGRGDEARPYLEQALGGPGAPLSPRLRLGACLMLAEIHSAAERWQAAAELYAAAFEVAAPAAQPVPA